MLQCIAHFMELSKMSEIPYRGEFIEEFEEFDEETQTLKRYGKYKVGNAIAIYEIIPEPAPLTGFDALSTRELVMLIIKELNIPEPIA